jgi:ribonuclease HII
VPDALLIDAVKLPDVPLPQRVLFHADTLCLSVAAASIVAKVTRDRWMADLDVQYPGYGFAQHKGYGTQLHQQRLAQRGPSPVHRTTFEPVRSLTTSHPQPFSSTERREGVLSVVWGEG